jgi:transcription elongation factor Elf1
MNDIRCAYCASTQKGDCEYEKTDTVYKMKCKKCGKVFGVTLQYTKNYQTFKLPFINK